MKKVLRIAVHVGRTGAKEDRWMLPWMHDSATAIIDHKMLSSGFNQLKMNRMKKLALKVFINVG